MRRINAPATRTHMYLLLRVMVRLFVFSFVLMALGVSIIGLAVAANTYPIPFDSKPDWSGTSSQYPQTPTAQLLVTYGLKHNIVLVHTYSKNALDDERASRLAYKFIFVEHAKTKWPTNGVYVVLGVFGQPDAHGEMRTWGYIFERDSAEHWKPRHVSREEMAKIESIVFHGPVASP